MNTEINPEFQPLPVALLERMQSLRSRLHALVTQHFPDTALSHTAADFALLQRIVDADVLSADDASGWEAMGIAFGDGLTARVPGLAWAQVTDQYGTDAVLRYRETTLQIGVATMLLKRAQAIEAIDVAHMADWLASFIAEKSHEYQ